MPVLPELVAYTVWLFIGDGVTMAIYGWLRIGPGLIGDFRAHWRIAARPAPRFRLRPMASPSGP